MTREPGRAPPRHAHGDLTSLAPHERLPEILVVKRGTVILSTKGLDQARGKDRGATMSSQETAPDSLEPVMDKPPLDPEVVGTGNPVLVRPVTVKDIRKTQVDRT